MTRGILNDLTGSVFGHLTVRGRAPNDKSENAQWSCSCECGNEVVVRGAFLKKRQIYCGHSCPLFIQSLTKDVAGKRFGRLVAIEPVSVGRLEKPIWRFRCDCGVIKDMVVYRATNGDAKSCGCLGVESRIRHGLSHTRDYHREAHKKWAKENPARVIENAAKRQRALRDRIPRWLNEEHRKEIDEIYRKAAKLTEETGIKHHVDHIMPIRAKNSSGLHVPWNLQVLTATENASKGNRVPDEIC